MKPTSIPSSILPTRLRAVAKQAIGFSLIEVMLAILVIGVAGLGAAALSLSGLRESHTSNNRGVAVELASELIERVKNNPTVLATDYLLNTASDGNTGTANALCYSAEEGCQLSEKARNDLREWANGVKDRLPGGTAVFCYSANPSTGTPEAPGCIADPSSKQPLVIKLWWNERAVLDPNAGNKQKVEEPGQLTAPLYYVTVGL